MDMDRLPSAEEIREFVIAGHGNLDKVRQMLKEQPSLLNTAHEWRPGDTETAIQGASHVGNRAIAEYLLEQGAPLEIWTATMLNLRGKVEKMLAADSTQIHAKSAHGIPLLPHAAFNGNIDLFRMLIENGTKDGLSQALSHAAVSGHLDLVKWIVEHEEPDLNWTNFGGKNAVEVAKEQGHEEIAAFLASQETGVC